MSNKKQGSLLHHNYKPKKLTHDYNDKYAQREWDAAHLSASSAVQSFDGDDLFLYEAHYQGFLEGLLWAKNQYATFHKYSKSELGPSYFKAPSRISSDGRVLVWDLLVKTANDVEVRQISYVQFEGNEYWCRSLKYAADGNLEIEDSQRIDPRNIVSWAFTPSLFSQFKEAEPYFRRNEFQYNEPSFFKFKVWKARKILFYMKNHNLTVEEFCAKFHMNPIKVHTLLHEDFQ